MASNFVVALNSLRIQMICTKEKMNLLCTWNIFNKDPKQKAWLEFWDNTGKAAAIHLQPTAANDDFQGLHAGAGSIELNVCFTLLNEMKAQFEDLKMKMDSIVPWSVSKTCIKWKFRYNLLSTISIKSISILPVGENELETFPNLACNYVTVTVPAPVPLLLSNQIISKYVQEFKELKSKVELLKTQLNRMCECVINKKGTEPQLYSTQSIVPVQDSVLNNMCNEENAAGATFSLILVNDDVTTVEESIVSAWESVSIDNFNDSEKEFDSQRSESEDSFADDVAMDVERACLSPINEENSDSNESTPTHENQSTGKNSSKSKPILNTTPPKNLQCKECKKKFKHPCILKRHLVVHSGQKTYACDICCKRFARADDLKLHNKRKHETLKPFPCDTCTKQFATAREKKVHERTHTGEKNYVCDVCQKRFTHSTTLETHKRIHTREKPYNCIECGIKYAHLTSFKRHQLSHTGKKPYHCTVCGKDFRDRSELIKHSRVHTGEKPFNCAYCNQHFRQKTTLLNHQKSQHSTELIK